MPDIDWQFTIVGCCLAAAAFFVVRRVVRLAGFGRNAPPGGCGGCGSCGSQPGSEPPPGFVPLESLHPPVETSQRHPGDRNRT